LSRRRRADPHLPDRTGITAQYRVPQLGRQSHPCFAGGDATSWAPVGARRWPFATHARN